jgi:hypothetical protein
MNGLDVLIEAAIYVQETESQESIGSQGSQGSTGTTKRTQPKRPVKRTSQTIDHSLFATKPDDPVLLSLYERYQYLIGKRYYSLPANQATLDQELAVVCQEMRKLSRDVNS